MPQALAQLARAAWVLAFVCGQEFWLHNTKVSSAFLTFCPL